MQHEKNRRKLKKENESELIGAVLTLCQKQHIERIN